MKKKKKKKNGRIRKSEIVQLRKKKYEEIKLNLIIY